MSEPVIIVPYSAEWPDWFAQIKAFLEPSLAEVARAIEHVGSTAIHGMAAKPIVDLDIVVDRSVFPQIRDRLAAIGYVHQGDKGIPDREAFDLADSRAREALPPHHLYACITGTAELRKHLLFRDYMRTHETDAQAYAALKYHLAEQFGDDRVGYTEGKSEFIRGILEKAEALAGE